MGFSETSEGTWEDDDGRTVQCLPEGVIVRSVVSPTETIETSSVTPSPDIYFLQRAVLEHVSQILTRTFEEASKVRAVLDNALRKPDSQMN